MSINNKFNLGDRVRHIRQQTYPWMRGEIVQINGVVGNEYGNRIEVHYRIRPDNGKGKGFHCTYPEDEWELLSKIEGGKL